VVPAGASLVVASPVQPVRGVAGRPLGPVRRLSPGVLGDRLPVTPGQSADQGTDVFHRLQPRLWPGEARPQPSQQLSTFPAASPDPILAAAAAFALAVVTRA
jgi:hypothetical protein